MSFTVYLDDCSDHSRLIHSLTQTVRLVSTLFPFIITESPTRLDELIREHDELTDSIPPEPNFIVTVNIYLIKVQTWMIPKGNEAAIG